MEKRIEDLLELEDINNEWSSAHNKIRFDCTLAAAATRRFEPFVKLVNQEANKLPSEPPTTRSQLHALLGQVDQLRAKLECILYASKRCNVDNARDILTATEDFCKTNPITADCSSACKAFELKIDKLCQ